MTEEQRDREKREVHSLLQKTADFLVSDREDFARALLYEVQDRIAPKSEDLCEIYPMVKQSPEVLGAIKTLVTACLRAGVPQLILNVNLPSCSGGVVATAQPKVRLAVIPKMDEKGMALLQQELRKTFESWNEEAFRQLADLPEELAHLSSFIEQLHKGELPLDVVLPTRDDEQKLGILYGWYTMVSKFREVLTETEEALFVRVGEHLVEVLG